MPRSKLFPTPDDAENAFYEAFERGDLAAMMSVWAAGDCVVCIHPTGPRLVGFDAVRESWAQIFAGSAPGLKVRTLETQRFDGQNVAVRALVEVLSAPGTRQTQSVVATNVYELTDNGWRMVVHHAAPAVDPAAPAAEPEAPSTPHTLH